METAVDEFVALENRAESVPLVLELLAHVGLAKRNRVERVRLLRVVVWPNLVGPQRDFLLDLVLRAVGRVADTRAHGEKDST